MEDRGTSPRRVEDGDVDPGRRQGTPARTGRDFWQVLAIAALVAATAGWTTVAVIALRAPGPGAIASPGLPGGSPDPAATDEVIPPPVGETHDAPELEALLPTEIDGTVLVIQSWTGAALIADDPWSASITAFLTSVDRTPTDLHVAQGYDPDEVLQGSIGVYALPGVDPGALQDALLDAWREDDPGMIVNQIVIGGKDVTEAVFGDDIASSFLYQRDGVVFDIETTDRALAVAALAALPESGPSSPPPSGSAGTSPTPAPTPG